MSVHSSLLWWAKTHHKLDGMVNILVACHVWQLSRQLHPRMNTKSESAMYLTCGMRTNAMASKTSQMQNRCKLNVTAQIAFGPSEFWKKERYHWKGGSHYTSPSLACKVHEVGRSV